MLWWVSDSPKLSVTARELLAEGRNRLVWSAASTWEASIKHRLGRLELPLPPAEFFPQQLRLNRIASLAIEDFHAIGAAALPDHHSDPFDRMLIAQAQVDRLILVSADDQLGRYDVERRW